MISQAKITYQSIMSNNQSIWDTLVEGILWNSSAWIEKNDFKDPNIKDEYVTKGNVTEQGIMKFFMNAMGSNFCVKKKGDLTDEKTLCIVPFTSTRKMGSIVVR
jgi:magnesium-transporting ATPase (P-type)